MTTLFIRHPAKAEAEGAMCHFALVADGGSIMQQGASALRGLGDLIASSRRVVLLLAASDVTLLHVKVPPLSNVRLKAALPSLVEDQILADPAECVLVAAPAQGDDGMRTIAVVQRAWLGPMVLAVLAQGARAVAALPAQLCLPLPPGGVSAAVGSNELTLRQGPYQGLGLAMAAAPPLALQTVRALAGDAPLTLYVPQDQLGEYQALIAEAAPTVSLEAEHWAHWITGARSAPLDLVPGLGAAGAKARDWRRWRWPLRLALLTVLVNIVGLNIEWMRMRGEADAVRQSMTQIYKATYPAETAILDPLLQMRQHIARARSGSGAVAPGEFNYLAAAYGEVARALPRKPEIASLDYRDKVLAIKVKPDTVNPAAVAQIKGALATRKLELTEAGAGNWRVSSKGGKQ